MDWSENFMHFWNKLARRNQKIKFRNSREAAEFVRHMVKTSKPNQEMIDMREKYVAIQAERNAILEARLGAGEHRAVRERLPRRESVRLRRETA